MQYKVGAKDYSVLELEENDFIHYLSSCNISDDEISSVKSFIDYDYQKIIIRKNLPEQFKSELLIHELLHAFLDDSGISDQTETEEKLIKLLSPRINLFIKENFKLKVF